MGGTISISPSRAEERLKVVIPFTLLIIFVLIYINTRSV
jgi:Cu/Ag efflux pump CusA